MIVTLFCQKGVAECDQVIADLKSLESQYPHQVVVIDIDSEPSLLKLYNGAVPVVEIGPYRLRNPITRTDLQVSLGAAQDRLSHYEKVDDPSFKKRQMRARTFSRSDQIAQLFTSHYMLVFNLFFLLYAGLPFVAPVLMRVGLTGPANVIYTVYSPLCHQFAFRSWFFFGEQPAYPRDLAGVPGLINFKDATGIDATDILAARAFIGNEKVGYKVALCERDVAIYGSMFLFGVLFAITGRKLKSLPWYLLILVGVVPIAVDGLSQLPSLITSPLFAFLPMRESTPFLRTLTGFLFGVSIAWYGYPFVEEAVDETRRLLKHKQAIVEQTETT
jgi:uncharacterized membrane protein